VEIKDWDDLLNPKLKGHIAQCTPDRSSSSHASYEVILAMPRLGQGMGLAEQTGGQHGNLHARSRDVPSVVAKGESPSAWQSPVIWPSPSTRWL